MERTNFKGRGMLQADTRQSYASSTMSSFIAPTGQDANLFTANSTSWTKKI